jgi:AraC-like DNA-binding protein
MDTIFSTDEVHPRDRFAYWHDVACRTIVEHDSHAEEPTRFAAHIRAASIGTSDAVLFGNSPMTVLHETKHLAHTRDDQIFLCKQIAGELLLEQEVRDCLLTPGSLTLLDPRLPYKGVFSRRSELLVWKFPRRELEARMGLTRDLVARRLTPIDGRSAFFAAYVSLVRDHIEDIPLSGAGQIESQLLDLTASAFSDGLRRKRNSSRSKTLARLNLKSAIEAHLADPTIDVATVATAAGISVSYANLVLAEEQTSLSRLILDRRLERCRVALRDPTQAHRSVSEIAYGWGFSDMTHFGRRFKQAYGVLPRDYRKAPDLRSPAGFLK